MCLLFIFNITKTCTTYCLLLFVLTKSTIYADRSVPLISLTTESIPHQNNSTHMFPQVHPPKQTHSFSQTLRPTGQHFFLDQVRKNSSMQNWEQQDLWPGRQGRGQGKARQAGTSQTSSTVPQALSRQSRSSGITWGQPQSCTHQTRLQ